jgi:membrane fusion protein, multidrug efflux system
MMRFSGYCTILSLFLALLLMAGCKGNNKDSLNQKGLSGRITVGGIILVPRSMENKILSTGTLSANEEVELRSEMPGRIVRINFEEGTSVQKGDLLVKINDQDLQAQLKKLQLDGKLAKDDLYRKQKLLDMKAVSQEEYDKSANSSGVIEAQMDLVKAQIAKTEVYAPFSGIVGLRSVSPGGFISSDKLIARLQQTDPIKIDFSIPEKYRDKLHKGSSIQFSVEGSDSIFIGKIYAIEPKIDPLTRNLSIRAICQNRKNLLVPGAFAKVEVLLDRIPDALIVPSEAIIPQLDGEKVFVVKNGKAKFQLIRSGIRTDREVQVEEGLFSQDTIIVSGLLQLKEGMDVKVRILQKTKQ